MQKADLESMLSRVEAATGPDSELDALLWLMTTDGATRKSSLVKSSTGAWPDYTIDETRDKTGRLITVPPFTSSIDAAVALVERLLPGIGLTITNQPEPTAWIFSECDEYEDGDFMVRVIVKETGETMPLAILAALLRVLISEAK